MTESELLKALAQALSGNQMWAILVVFGVNFTLGVLRALLDKTFSWEKLPGILEKTLPIFGYGVVSVAASATLAPSVAGTISWVAAAGAILRYALPTLRDGTGIVKGFLPAPDLAAQAPADAITITNLILNPATRAEGKNKLAGYDTKYGAHAGGGLKALISDAVRAMAAQ